MTFHKFSVVVVTTAIKTSNPRSDGQCVPKAMRWVLFFGLLWLGLYESAGRIVVFEGRTAPSKHANTVSQAEHSSPSVFKTEFRDGAATPTGKRQRPPSFALNAAAEATAFLSTHLTSLQHFASWSPYNDSLGRPVPSAGRYLVFTYGPEQGINGFGAMFQWYAAALLLAHRYNRTLIELHPLPLPRQRATSTPLSHGHPLVGNATATLAAAQAAAAVLAQAGWTAAAALAGTASDAGSPDDVRIPASARLFSRLARVNDPWKRTPLAACGGAKAGCLFHAPASVGLTLLPPDVVAALPRRHDSGLNETALLLLAQRLLNSASASPASLAAPAFTEPASPASAGGSQSTAAASVDDAELASVAIPLLDIDAEERRLYRLMRRGRTFAGGNSSAYAVAAAFVGADGYDPSGRAIKLDVDGAKVGFNDPADAPVVRVDTIARYRGVMLALSAGLEPAHALALEQLHAIAAKVAAAESVAAKAKDSGSNKQQHSPISGDDDALAGTAPAPYLRNAQAFADRLNGTCSRIASCIAVLLAGPPTVAEASHSAANAWLCCGGSSIAAGTSAGSASVSAADTARLRQLQLRYALQCAMPSDSESDATWPQRRQSFIDGYITAAWTSHQHGEQLRIARRRAELLRRSPVGNTSASNASDPVLRPRDLVVPQTMQLQRSDDPALRPFVTADGCNDEAPQLGRCDAELQAWLQQPWEGSLTASIPSSGLPAVLTTASTAKAAADNYGIATGWQRLWFPAHQAFLFRPRPSVAQLAPFTRRSALADSNYDSGEVLHRDSSSPSSGDGGSPIATASASPGASVGIHFRQGDALVVGWRSKAPLSAYAEQTVRAAAAMHGVSQARPAALRPDGVWMDVPAAAAALDAHVDDSSAAVDQTLREAVEYAASAAQPQQQWNWSLALASDSASARTDLSAAVALGHLDLHFQDLFGPRSSIGSGGGIFGSTSATARWQPAAPGSAEHIAALRRALLLDTNSGSSAAANSVSTEVSSPSAAAFLDRGPYTKPSALLTSGAPILTVAGGRNGFVQPTGAAGRMTSANDSPSRAAGAVADASTAGAADAFVHTESWIDATMDAAAAAAAAPEHSLSAATTVAVAATTLDAAGNVEAASAVSSQSSAASSFGSAPAVTALDVSRRAYDLASRTDPRVKVMVSPPPPPPLPPFRATASDATAAGGRAGGSSGSTTEPGGAASEIEAAPTRTPSPAFLDSLRSYLRYIADASAAVPASAAAPAVAGGAAMEPAPEVQPAAPQLRLFRIAEDTFPIAAEAQAAAHAALRRLDALTLPAATAPSAASRLGQEAQQELQRAAAILRQQLGLASRAVAVAPAGELGSELQHQLLPPTAVAAVLGSPPAAAAAAVHAVTAGVVADIDILADSAALVGTGLSQVSRTAYEVAAARGAALLPPIALDADSLRSLPLPHPYAILAPWRAAVPSGSSE